MSKDNFSQILPINQVEISDLKYCLQYQVSIEEILCDSSFNTSENEMRVARKCYKKVLLIVFLNLTLFEMISF